MFMHMHSLYLTACIFVYYFSFAICLFFRLYCSQQEIEIKQSQEIFQEIKMFKRAERPKGGQQVSYILSGI